MSISTIELNGDDSYVELRTSITAGELVLDFTVDHQAAAVGFDLDDTIAIRDWLTFTINECKRAVES